MSGGYHYKFSNFKIERRERERGETNKNFLTETKMKE
jgi:hypothetical protein